MRISGFLPAVLLLPCLACAAPKAGDKVQVQWHGGWYGATVLEVGTGAQQGSYKIRYDGYGSNWDEYVPLSRIAADGNEKKQTAPAAAESAAGSAATASPEGRYLCQAFEAGQLHNQGEFVLSAGGGYRDLTYGTAGRWQFDKASGAITFRGGSLANGAQARLVTTGQGKTAVQFTWPGDATRWCYRQKK